MNMLIETEVNIKSEFIGKLIKNPVINMVVMTTK